MLKITRRLVAVALTATAIAVSAQHESGRAAMFAQPVMALGRAATALVSPEATMARSAQQPLASTI
jgi:hypothetical protein